MVRAKTLDVVQGLNKKGQRVSGSSLPTYCTYMQSASWRRLRLQALTRDKFRCRICDSSNDLEVHHRRYPRRSRWDLDCVDALTTLCNVCHLGVTDLLRKRRYASKAKPALMSVKRLTPMRKGEAAFERLHNVAVQDQKRITPTYAQRTIS